MNYQDQGERPNSTLALLTIRETIARLKIGRSKFYLEVQAGRIPLRKVGGASRVRADELNAYIEGLLAFGDTEGECI